MKVLLLALFISILTNFVLGNNPSKKDTSTQLSYNEYMSEFGTDATSIAIIELFFNKRNKVGIGQMSFLPVSAGVSVVAPPVGLVVMAMSTPLFINGLLVRRKYSLKNLSIALDNYKRKNLLSARFKKKVTQIIKEKQIRKHEEIIETNYIALKQIKPTP